MRGQRRFLNALLGIFLFTTTLVFADDSKLPQYEWGNLPIKIRKFSYSAGLEYVFSSYAGGASDEGIFRDRHLLQVFVKDKEVVAYAYGSAEGKMRSDVFVQDAANTMIGGKRNQLFIFTGNKFEPTDDFQEIRKRIGDFEDYENAFPDCVVDGKMFPEAHFKEISMHDFWWEIGGNSKQYILESLMKGLERDIKNSVANISEVLKIKNIQIAKLMEELLNRAAIAKYAANIETIELLEAQVAQYKNEAAYWKHAFKTGVDNPLDRSWLPKD